MCNFYDIDFDEEDDSNENELLRNDQKAQEFVMSMVAKTKKNRFMSDVNQLKAQIFHKIKQIVSYLDINNEIEMFYNMEKIFKKIYEIHCNPALKKKKVIGIAGGFSSGKSTFINSLISKEILPQDTNPSSAIPTYILYGKDNINIKAQNFFLKNLNLTQDELGAISHQFQEKHGITFSRILENIFVAINSFPYKNICFLDTPGYTKPDFNIKSDNTDIETARKHLLSVDYMIWVCNVENGTITKNDLAFIKSLHLSNDKKILVVLNKADRKMEEDLKSIKKQVEQELSNPKFLLHY